jgi:HlyD family secretion protein
MPGAIGSHMKPNRIHPHTFSRTATGLAAFTAVPTAAAHPPAWLNTSGWRRLPGLVAALGAPFWVAAWCAAGEPPTPKPAEAPPTHTMTRAPSKAKGQFEAVFEAIGMAPVKLEPKGWTDLTVVEAVPHGARVKKGDVLVRLDLEKLNEQLEELQLDRPASVLALELATAELDNLKLTTPLKLEAARRTQRVTEEDLAYFEKIGREQREKAARFNVKNAEQRLDGAREELKQLEKMYKADDLVEDTEEIILRRSKFAVESAEYSLEATKLGTEHSLKTGIPREAETLKSSKRDQDLALALAGETVHRTLSKKSLDLEKQMRDQKKAERKLVELKKDQATLSRITAPMDGLVYYGACEGGKWTTGATLAKKLLPTGKLTPNEVFMTVVDPDKLMLKAVVQEADLAPLKPGLEGTAAPVSAPDLKLPVKLEDISPVPLPTGGFEARLAVQTDPARRLVPGMNCKVSLGEPSKPEPLRAPKEAVFTEGDQSQVFVLKADGQSEKRVVRTGAADEKTVEILEGLAEGERILLSKPK